jgi:hypothetical protein
LRLGGKRQNKDKKDDKAPLGNEIHVRPFPRKLAPLQQENHGSYGPKKPPITLAFNSFGPPDFPLDPSIHPAKIPRLIAPEPAKNSLCKEVWEPLFGQFVTSSSCSASPSMGCIATSSFTCF